MGCPLSTSCHHSAPSLCPDPDNSDFCKEKGVPSPLCERYLWIWFTSLFLFLPHPPPPTLACFHQPTPDSPAPFLTYFSKASTTCSHTWQKRQGWRVLQSVMVQPEGPLGPSHQRSLFLVLKTAGGNLAQSLAGLWVLSSFHPLVKCKVTLRDSHQT